MCVSSRFCACVFFRQRRPRYPADFANDCSEYESKIGKTVKLPVLWLGAPWLTALGWMGWGKTLGGNRPPPPGGSQQIGKAVTRYRRAQSQTVQCNEIHPPLPLAMRPTTSSVSILRPPPLASCRLRLPALSAVSQVTGMVGLLMHYQMLYGSIVYFFSFFNTNR